MLKNEVREILRYIKEGNNYYKLKDIDTPYEAYVIRNGVWRGVGVPINNQEIIENNYYEKFERIRICIDKIKIEDEEKYLLELLTDSKYAYEQFAMICMDFISPGEDGENRKLIIEKPELWTKRWKDLLGNKLEENMDYSYLGELIILKHLIDSGNNVKMTRQGTYDIEDENSNYEIKTTIMRYTSEIEVHSQYQLNTLDIKPLKLYFVRLEEAMTGKSINDLYEELKNVGYCIDDIEIKLKEISFESRNRKYNILEIREYDVDDNFPKITNKDFKGEKIPTNIKNIKYVIDLDGIDYNKVV